MESNSIIVQALAAGAVAAVRPNSLIQKNDRAIDSIYVELKEALRDKYPRVDAAMLDVGPGSKERQQLLQAQLSESGALDDASLQEKAKLLLEKINEYEPQAAMALGLLSPDEPY